MMRSTPHARDEARRVRPADPTRATRVIVRTNVVRRALAAVILLLLALNAMSLTIVSLWDRCRSPWRFLSVVVLGVAIDEAVQFHEMFVPALRNAFGFSGALTFAWVVPYSGLVLALAAIAIRAVLALPRRQRAQVVIAAMVFLAGAIGMEVVGAAYADANGQKNLVFALLTTLEETLEMVGVAIAIDAFVHLLVGHRVTIDVEWAGQRPPCGVPRVARAEASGGPAGRHHPNRVRGAADGGLILDAAR